MSSNDGETVALTLRVPIALHDRLKIMSLITGTSVNELIVDKLYEISESSRIETIRKLVVEERSER